MIIYRTKRFEKSYKKLSSQNKLLADKAIRLFVQNTSDPKLKNHALKGKYSGLRSFSAAYDLRIIYKEEGNHIKVIMIDVGTHSQVY
jgi:addiction module RelE/StbE family toxin